MDRRVVVIDELARAGCFEIADDILHAGDAVWDFHCSRLRSHIGFHPARMEGESAYSPVLEVYGKSFDDEIECCLGRSVRVKAAIGKLGNGGHVGR